MNRAELAAVNGVPAELIDAGGRLVVTPNFATLEGQRNVPADLRPGESLAAFLERHVPGIQSGAWSVSIAGAAVPQAMWRTTFPKHGMLIACRATGGKQVVAIVALAVLSYFTLGAGLAAWGTTATAIAATTGLSVTMVGVGAFVAGSVLINKVLAPKVPKAQSAEAARAVYSLSGQRNSARPNQPIPTLWGEMRVTPDVASAAYTWFEGDDQYLSLILLGGINVHSAADLAVGDTPFSGYSDVSLFYSGFPGMASQDIPLYSNADTISGAELEKNGPWVVRTSSPDVVALQLDFEGQLYDVGVKGNTLPNSVQLFIETRPVGSDNWVPASSPTLTNSTADVLRRTFTLQVAQGQYDVRVRLGPPTWDEGEGKDQCKIGWNVLKSIQPDQTDYSGWGRIGIKIRASGQLSGSLDTVRATYRARPMPIWNGSAWVTATARDNGLSNPGAILLQTMRGVYANGELQFGFGLPDEQIDIEGLKAFMLHCTANGYTYDKWVTDAVSLGQFCQEVALAGMGEFSWTDGSRPTAVFVSSGQPLSGVVNMANMLKASFEVSYSLSNAADGIEYQYLDRERNWETQTLRVSAPGVTTMLNPARITGEGVTSEAHAAIMARYHLAQSLYQFKTIGYTADIEHLDYRRLSLLSISHDLTQWGFGGRLVSAQRVAGKVVLQLDEAVPPLAQAFIGLRLPGYRDYRVFQVEALSIAGDQVTLADPWPSGLPLPGATEDDPAHDTLWCYDFKPTPGYRVRVVSMEPEADLKGARISCVPEGPEFWDYVLNGNYVPAPNGSSLTANLPVASNLQITRSRVKVGAGWEHELSATWDVTGNYDHAQVWAAPAGQPLVLIDSNVYGTRLAWRVPSDQTWSVEVRPFDGLGRMGTVASVIFTDPSVLVGGVLGLTAAVETNGVVLRWNTPQDIDSIDYAATRIRLGLAGGSWETASPVFEGKANTCNLGWLQAGQLMFYAVHVNSAGDTSAPVFTSISIVPPGQPVVTGLAWQSLVELAWDAVSATQPLRGYEVRLGDVYAGAQLLSTLDALSFSQTVSAAGNYRYWVAAIDLGGNRGAPGTVLVTVLPDISEAIQELQEGLDEVVQDLVELGQDTDQKILAEAAARGTAIEAVTQLITEGDEQLAQQIENISASSTGYVRANVLYNGGFEYGMDGWGGNVSSFVAYDSVVGRITQSVTHPASGILFTSEAQAGQGLWYAAAMEVQMHAAGGQWRLRIQFYNAAHADISGVVGPWNGPTDFSNFTAAVRQATAIEAQAPAGAAFLRFSVDWINASGSVLGFARAKVEVGRKPITSYITGAPDAGTLAAIQTERTARANGDAAEALARETLAAQVGQVAASVTTEASVRAQADGQLFAKYGVRLTVDGKVSGFIQNNDGTQSNFVVLSDRFAWAMEGAGGEIKYPVVFGSIGGVASFGFTGNMFLDGVLKARMLDADQIYAYHIRSLEIETRHLKALAVTAEKISVGSLSSIVPNLGIVVYGRLVSADGMMSVDLDNKSIHMLKNGRRVQISPSGIYMGADDGVGNRLEYNLDSGAMLLNGSFTADAINAVNTLNIAGQGATTLALVRSGSSNYYGGDNADNWITMLSLAVTLKSGGNGVVAFISHMEVPTTAITQIPEFRLFNQTTGQEIKRWMGKKLFEEDQSNVRDTEITLVDFNPVIGANTYLLQTMHRQQWVTHMDQRLTILASHR
ncbi:hypothetical protein ASF44_14485 [Pseudorhodoferax sp. Leaf274]|nr:hypothetical protein ASF44_14485 [Pseudorhodoferax sp. Leaf274]